MKKALALILSGILCCGLLAACSGTKKEEPVPAAPESSSPGGVAGSAASSVAVDAVATPEPNADDTLVDLTLLSKTMVYAEVYNMMVNPEEYMGKTIKTNGLYFASYDPQLDTYYHFVVIEDATACCEQGLEFMMAGEATYPDDFPADETPVQVTGVWGNYEEDGYTFYCIAADSLTVQ